MEELSKCHLGSDTTRRWNTYENYILFDFSSLKFSTCEIERENERLMDALLAGRFLLLSLANTQDAYFVRTSLIILTFVGCRFTINIFCIIAVVIVGSRRSYSKIFIYIYRRKPVFNMNAYVRTNVQYT